MNLERVFIVVFSLVLAFVITLFFWEETKDFDINSKINDSKFNNFFASVGALLTGLSILYASLQIVESKKNREIMFLPNILPKDTIFSTTNSITPLKNISREGVQNEDVAYIELFNAGPGLAKKVNIIWDYSGKEVIESLQKENISNYTITYPDPSYAQKIKFVYIAPNQMVKVEVPQFYFQLYRLDMNPKLPSNHFGPARKIHKPPLTLKFNYIDIFGQQHIDKYYTKIEFNERNTVKLTFVFSY